MDMINSKSWRVVVFIVTLVCLAACASPPPVNSGADYFAQGLYDQAAEQWRQPALDGDPVAQHNMGALSRDGLGQTPRSYNDAAAWFLKSAQQTYVPAMVSLAEVQILLGQETAAESWLKLAARWGSQEAIDTLKARNLPVPEPDLYTALVQDQNLEKMRAVGVLLRPPIRKIHSKGSGREN
jgi:TPR repeat protein